jgi:deoxyribodipyrimidine photolyase-like uncharacterized protein
MTRPSFRRQLWRFAWGYASLSDWLPVAVTFHQRSHYRRISRRWGIFFRTRGPRA